MESVPARRLVAAAVFFVAGLVIAVVDGVLAFFLVPALVGGAICAAVLIVTGHRRHQPPVTVPDAFHEYGASIDVINVSRIRVAGLGGLGLLVVAAGIAWLFPLIWTTMLLGLAGGLVLGAGLILSRRR